MNKHEYICNITQAVSKKSTCNRAKVGAVFVTDGYEILATGYNSTPKGFKTCDEAGHIIKNGSCIATVHAEQNAITQAAKRGISLCGATVYVTHSPCQMCAKLIINLGVKKVVMKQIYKDELPIEWLRVAGITVRTWDEEYEYVEYIRPKPEKINRPGGNE